MSNNAPEAVAANCDKPGEHMRRWSIYAAGFAFFLLVAAGLAFWKFVPLVQPVTVSSLSPSEAHRVSLVELRKFIDRNFEIRLEDVRSGASRVVFQSPDEGRPPGSERIVWSRDGSRFLLLGRHFFVTERGKLSSGELAYLMMDVQSGQIWCNSSQQSQYPGFGIEELRSVPWRDWEPG